MFTINETPDLEKNTIIITCPCCRSHQIQIRNYGKRTGGALGTLAGVAMGFSSFIGGARMGAVAGLSAGPIGIVLGGLSGAILGGLIGGATGCSIGAKLGTVVDDRILENYQCLECDYSFSQ